MGPDEGPTTSSSSTSERAALGVFVVALVVAVPVLLWFGREQWFFLDDFDFLAHRDLASPGNLLEPHNEHWTTLPIVVYRLIFQVVGARHYWPYLLPVITAHLASASLLRVLMRRAGVDAWIATTACIAFVFLGAGREDIVVAFQITFAGALALGLAAIVLVDRDGPLGWVDAAAVACSIGALACSGIGVAMVVAVGLACLLRRDWIRAAVQIGVPGAVYAAWYLAYGSDAPTTPRPSLPEAATFVGWTGVATAEGLARNPVVAVLLGGVAVAGAIVAVRTLLPRWRRGGASTSDAAPDVASAGDGIVEPAWRAQATVLALAGAAVFLSVATAWSRAGAFPVDRDEVPTRYIHLFVALTLPAVACGLTVVARRVPVRHLGVVGACLLLLLGLPFNVRSLRAEGTDRLTLGNEEAVRILAAVAVAQDTPPDLVPYSSAAPDVTAGWLQRTAAAGDLRPPPDPMDPHYAAEAGLALSFERLPTPPDAGCAPLEAPVDLQPGDTLTVESDGMIVAHPSPAGVVQLTFPTLGDDAVTLEAIRPLRIRGARGVEPGEVVELCPAG